MGTAFLSRNSCAFHQMRNCHIVSPPTPFIPGTLGYNWFLNMAINQSFENYRRLSPLFQMALLVALLPLPFHTTFSKHQKRVRYPRNQCREQIRVSVYSIWSRKIKIKPEIASINHPICILLVWMGCRRPPRCWGAESRMTLHCKVKGFTPSKRCLFPFLRDTFCI